MEANEANGRRNMEVCAALVDRCPVSASNREVLRFVASKLVPELRPGAGAISRTELAKSSRKAMYRFALKRHERNRQLYERVIGQPATVVVAPIPGSYDDVPASVHGAASPRGWAPAAGATEREREHNRALLKAAARFTGFDTVFEMLDYSLNNGIRPGACRDCGAVVEDVVGEPGRELTPAAVFCDKCGARDVVDVLQLAGVLS